MNNNKCVRISILIWGLIISADVHAEFVMDWEADTASPAFSGTTADNINAPFGRATDQTPFVYERVNDPDTNQQYYHMIVGSPDDGFAQEVYIRVGGACSGCQSFNGIGSSGSASGGRSDETNGNGSDPFGTGVNVFGVPYNQDTTFTGLGSGNPRRVQMRQLLVDGDLTLDFSKQAYLEKPVMSLNIDSVDFQSELIIDGSGISYDDDTTAATITNTVTLLDPDMPAGSASFDVVTDSQDSIVSAGRYTHTPGPGTGAFGTYDYAIDNFDKDAVDWTIPGQL